MVATNLDEEPGAKSSLLNLSPLGCFSATTEVGCRQAEGSSRKIQAEIIPQLGYNLRLRISVAFCSPAKSLTFSGLMEDLNGRPISWQEVKVGPFAGHHTPQTSISFRFLQKQNAVASFTGQDPFPVTSKRAI